MVISFFNQKGGVGKTTSSVLLIDYLLNEGKKVLAIDLDPQGSLSEVFASEYEFTLLDYFMKSQVLEACITSINSHLDILASNVRLMNLPQIDSAYLDDEKINFLPLFKNYDYVIIDSQPSFSWYSRLTLKMANYILMPTQMSRFSFEALEGALKEINHMHSNDFRGAYVFENKFRKQKIILKENFRELFKERLGNSFLNISLPEAISIDERTAEEDNYFQKEKPNAQVKYFFDELMRGFLHE